MKHYRFKIYKKLALYSSLFTIVTFIILGFYYANLISKTAKDKVTDVTYNYFNQMDTNLSNLTSEVNNIADNLSRDESIVKILEAQSKDYFQKVKEKSSIEEILKTTLGTSSMLDSISLFSENQDFYAGSSIFDMEYSDLKQNGLVDVVKDGPEQMVFVDNRLFLKLMKYVDWEERIKNKMIFIRRIRINNSDQEAILFILLKREVIKRTEDDPSDLIILSKKDGMIWTSMGDMEPDTISLILKLATKDSGVVEKTINQVKSTLTYKKTMFNDWLLVSIIPSDYINKDVKGIYNYVLLVIFLSTILNGVFAILSFFKMTERLVLLKNAISQFNRFGTWKKVPKKVSHLSFRTKVIVFFGVVCFLPFCIGTVAINEFGSRLVQNRINEFQVRSFDYLEGNVNILLSRYTRMVNYFVLNRSLQNTIEEIRENDMQVKGLKHYFNNKLIDLMIYSEGVKNISVFNSELEQLHTESRNVGKGIELNEEDLKNSARAVTWLPVGVDSSGNNIFCAVGRVKKLENLSTLGFVRIDIDERFLYRQYKDIVSNNENKVYVTSQTHKIISSSSAEEINQYDPYADVMLKRKVFKDGSVLFCNRLNNGWLLKYFIPAGSLSQTNNLSIQRLIAIIGLLLIITVLYSYFVASSLIGPLKKLVENFRKKQIKAVKIDRTGDEIEELSYHYNMMVDNIQSLTTQNFNAAIRERALQTHAKEAELNALQAQINSHFLYNTLESIRWMIVTKETELAENMILLLSKFLRLTVNRGELMIPLKTELEHANIYINLQKIRYENKVNITWEVENRFLEYKVVRLILQPIIENCIYHGIELKKGIGMIYVKIGEEENKLCIRVEDDGIGMDDEKLRYLHRVLEGKISSRSIGLKNVDDRIKIACGPQYGLKVEKREGNGTKIIICLPIQF